MKILCIHGIGGKDASVSEWSPKWKKAIAGSLSKPENDIEFRFLEIDTIFEKYKKKNGIKYARILVKLLADWVSTSLITPSRGLGISENIRWYAGMVIQFVQDGELRNELSELFDKELNNNPPDIIYTHSLGTLLTYDYFRKQTVKGSSFDDINLITSGSQIGHPALLRFFGGSIETLAVKHWFNFHNQNDKVFAYESLGVDADNFTEIETPFAGGLLSINHEALDYIQHANALKEVWPVLSSANVTARSFKKTILLESIKSIKKSITKTSTQKALLVGINDYPDTENQLNGCMNDVFRMSEVLQEAGFKPEDIKVVFNERATSKNLRLTMDWLLKDARDGDVRFFYYSGHGAQIPAGDIHQEDDGLDECLVTYDFDWTRENSYTDKEFLSAYSKLPFGVDFIAMLDCCHSGGIARDGMFKARGVNPPDDIRHRVIKWDSKREMWIPRETELANKKLFTTQTKHADLFIGKNKNTHRFGRAISLWSEADHFQKAKKDYGAKGPYLPLIIEACQESEYSYEYKHGVTSYGAFTYCMSTILREATKAGKSSKLSFNALVEKAGARLKELGYQQTPQVIGPREKRNRPVPILNL